MNTHQNKTRYLRSNAHATALGPNCIDGLWWLTVCAPRTKCKYVYTPNMLGFPISSFFSLYIFFFFISLLRLLVLLPPKKKVTNGIFFSRYILAYASTHPSSHRHAARNANDSNSFHCAISHFDIYRRQIIWYVSVLLHIFYTMNAFASFVYYIFFPLQYWIT